MWAGMKASAVFSKQGFILSRAPDPTSQEEGQVTSTCSIGIQSLSKPLCKASLMFHNHLKNVKTQPSNLIGRATFQSLEQLVVHDVTRPSSRANVLGSGARD